MNKKNIIQERKMTQDDSKKNSEKGNTTQNFRARKWVFTFNNYENKDLKFLTQYFDSKKYKYIIGEEIGENKTPHLQGYFEAKSQIWFSALKKINNKIHFEKAKGNRLKNLIYCSKDNKFVSNFDNENYIFKKKLNNNIIENEYKNVIWKKWQKEVIDIINEKPNNRKIYVFIDEKGNTGKSFLCKYIAIKFKGVIIADGKKDNIFNQVKNSMDNNIEPKIILLDIPRQNKNFINYGVIEQLKNGLIYSGKYEGGQCIFNYPHVLIFCNQELEYHYMSEDRWVIKWINKEE